MKAQADDLRTECAALDRFLTGMSEGDWQRRTAFFDWTVGDEMMHLHLIDLFGLQSMTDAEGFAATVAQVRAKQARGIELSAQMRERFGSLAPKDMLALWRDTWVKMCERFALDDPKRRIPWFGPSMGVRSFATARQMEVWAHGQDIYDAFGVRRENADSIRNICDLGVRTYSWSFQNRGETAPVPLPHVVLQGPSGAEWRWNEEGAERIEGKAEDFALVVTQRRNVADTGLAVAGSSAERWMAIAQCFAGPPEAPPKPGARVVVTST
jgi:uncharacterized protein (TIGR03084 family)